MLLWFQSLTPKEQNKLSKREDEWRNRLEKRDAEWTRKLEKREFELNRLLEENELDWRRQEQKMTEDLLKITRELKDALQQAEGCNNVFVTFEQHLMNLYYTSPVVPKRWSADNFQGSNTEVW